jgi:hypothetical protein
MPFQEKIDTLKSSTSNFFSKLFKTLLFLIFIGLLITWGLTKYTYSTGERAGVVSKFSKKGYLFKTYEGELNVGAQGQVGNMNNNLWNFTVHNSNDTAIVSKLEDAMLKGKRVLLHYEQRLIKFSWMGDTEYFVTDVRVAP